MSLFSVLQARRRGASRAGPPSPRPVGRRSSALALALLLALPVLGSGPAAASPCTLRGTSGPDVLRGTDGADVICGGGGGDVVYALEGDDVVFGGPGSDTILGGGGRDTLVGGRGADRLEGGPGADLLHTRDDVRGNDAAGGGGGSDVCRADRRDWCGTDGSAFAGSIAAIDRETRERMTSSWRPGCPVPLGDLRLLTLNHWGRDGRVHRGELVVHEDHARGVLRVMRRLFDVRFPIARMRLVDEYGGDDLRSMDANNTSAFNCRRVTGGTAWSEHAYGRAVDVNPIQNPYVGRDGTVLPSAGARFLDRSRRVRGMIHDGDSVVRAFSRIGWSWGGRWTSLKDYMHFSSTGR